MSKKLKHKIKGVERSDDSEVIALIKQLQQHISYLEKKIDGLIKKVGSGSGEERSGGYKGFKSRPSRGGSSSYAGRDKKYGGSGSARKSSFGSSKPRRTGPSSYAKPTAKPDSASQGKFYEGIRTKKVKKLPPKKD